MLGLVPTVDGPRSDPHLPPAFGTSLCSGCRTLGARGRDARAERGQDAGGASRMVTRRHGLSIRRHPDEGHGARPLPAVLAAIEAAVPVQPVHVDPSRLALARASPGADLPDRRPGHQAGRRVVIRPWRLVHRPQPVDCGRRAALVELRGLCTGRCSHAPARRRSARRRPRPRAQGDEASLDM